MSIRRLNRLKMVMVDMLAMTVRTDRPAGAAPVACTGGNQALPARSSIDQVDFVVPAIAFLAMGDADASDEMRVAKDRKSIMIKRYGWTYTYTPTKVR